jgi:hypothetical protein
MSGKSTRLNPSSLRMKTGGSAACVATFLSGFGLTRDRRSKIALYSLTVLRAFLSLVRMAFGMPQKAKASDAQNAASSIAGTVNLDTNHSQANNLAGVTVTLSGPASGAAAKSAITDESGHFQFAQLTAGTYTLEVNAEGFKPWSKTVTLVAGQAAVQDATIEINAVQRENRSSGRGYRSLHKQRGTCRERQRPPTENALPRGAEIHGGGTRCCSVNEVPKSHGWCRSIFQLGSL